MPVWASVLLPIVTGLIGVLGGLYGTWLGVAQNRDQERGRVLREAAGEFAKRLGGAANAVRYAVGVGASSGDPLNGAENLVGETANALAPVELLFDEPTGEAAHAAREELAGAVAALRGGDTARAQAAYERADERRREFNERAGQAIWQGERRPSVAGRRA